MPLTTLQKLEEARQAYHEIMVGQNVSRVIDQNGESVSYSKINVNALLSYIRTLELELAGPGAPAYRGPLKFLFGARRF